MLCTPLLRGNVTLCDVDVVQVSSGAAPAAACDTYGGSMPHLHHRGGVFLEWFQKRSPPHIKLLCAGSDMEVEVVEGDQAAAWEDTPASSTLPVASAVALRRGTGGRSREEWMATVVQVRRV